MAITGDSAQNPASAGLVAPSDRLLFLNQSQVAGDTDPFTVMPYPGIGEAPVVFVNFSSLLTFFVCSAGYDDRIAEAMQLHIVRNFLTQRIGAIADRSKELQLRHDRAVIIGKHEIWM